MKRLVYLLLLLCLTISSYGYNEEKHLADSMYAAGMYGKSVELYQKILQRGDNANIYYNLGNAYYRMHDLAHAILNYERAANREPGDSDIRFNLTLARSKTIDKIESADDFFLVYWFRSFVNSMNTDQWGRLSVFMFVCMLLSVLVLVFGRKMFLRKIAFTAGILSLSFVILFNIFAYIQREQYLDNTHAIVMKASAVKSTPAESGTALFELHEGTKVKILDNSMRLWVEIQLSDGKTGWIPVNKLEMI